MRAVQHHHALLAGALASVLVWLWLSVFAPGWVQPWQERITDAIWRLGSYTQDERRLILIDVDERSLLVELRPELVEIRDLNLGAEAHVAGIRLQFAEDQAQRLAQPKPEVIRA